MLGLLRKILPGKPETPSHVPQPTLTEVSIANTPGFAIAPYLQPYENMPMLAGKALHDWVLQNIPQPLQRQVWGEAERVWLLHLRDALGANYFLLESDNALLLSTLNPNTAQTTVNFMAKAVKRIVATLSGIAEPAEWGRDILVVLDDVETYYRYVSYFYPEAGQFALSGGMYINSGVGHFVTVKDNLYAMEPIIVHEMTHACVSHLPLPTWLNEGIAVNTERKLVSPRGCCGCSAQQMHQKHLAFWDEGKIQEFWSGKSFARPDEGNELSYDLARIIVELMAKDWDAFAQFVRAANFADAGYAAAHQYMQCDLGELVCALLETPADSAWRPHLSN